MYWMNSIFSWNSVPDLYGPGTGLRGNKDLRNFQHCWKRCENRILFFFPVFQDIGGLAIQHFANGFERTEPYGFCLPGLQYRKIGQCQLHFFRKLIQRHFPPGHLLPPMVLFGASSSSTASKALERAFSSVISSPMIFACAELLVPPFACPVTEM